MSDIPPIRLLALARLLPAGAKGEARDKIGKDLKPLLEAIGADWPDRLDAVLAGLEADGAVAGKSRARRRRRSGSR